MVTLIIVVYKTNKLLLKRFLRLVGNKYPLIIVNNSSNYNFKSFKISKKTRIIKTKNNGNGNGINIGLKKCKTRFALYLDTDIIISKNFIDKLLNKRTIDKEFAVLIPNNGNTKSKKKLTETYTQEGSVMLFNLKKIKKIGFFDENFFLYYEEIDLFFKCKINNLKVYLISSLKFKHKKATSIIDDTGNVKKLRSWHYMWSMFYYYKKNYNFITAMKKTHVIILKDIVMILCYLILFNKKKTSERFYRLYGVFSAILGLKSFFRI